MALDPYALCPCGSGQKIKFCCSADIQQELDRIIRAIQGDQRAAALDQINRSLATHPDKPSLLVLKCDLLLSMRDYDNAQKAIDHFLAVHPQNPTAHSLAATIAGLRGNVRQAIERLQTALEKAGGSINEHVHGSLSIVGELLLGMGDVQGAYGHLLLYFAASSDENSRGAQLLASIRQSSRIPLLLRQERYLVPAPEGVSWKSRFDDAMALASKGCWLKACEQFISLQERVQNEPAIIRNIATLRGYLGDTAGAALWLRKYATLESVPMEDRIESEAIAQLIDPNVPRASLDAVELTFTINDVDRAMERLLADKRLAPENRDAFLQQLEENEVPPRAVFTLLDRPLPASGEGLTLDSTPRSLSDALVYGRETDREPRVVATCERTPQFDQVKAILTEVLGDTLVSVNEEVIGQVPEEMVALRIALYPPRNTKRANYEKMVKDARIEVITQKWPQLKHRFLDGQTPAAAAASPQYRLRLQAAILVLEFQAGNGLEFDFNDLRRQLGLPTLETIDPTGVNIDELPVWRLRRLDIARLSDEQLRNAFARSVFYVDADSVLPLGRELIRRESTHEMLDPADVYSIVIRLTPSPEESIKLAEEAQEYMKRKGQSPAPFMLMELPARIASGDGPGADRLIRTLSTVHRNEPGVNDALVSILMQMGLISPEGRVRRPAGEAPAPAPAGGLWTPDAPDAPAAPTGETKSGLWLPGMD